VVGFLLRFNLVFHQECDDQGPVIALLDIVHGRGGHDILYDHTLDLFDLGSDIENPIQSLMLEQSNRFVRCQHVLRIGINCNLGKLGGKEGCDHYRGA